MDIRLRYFCIVFLIFQSFCQKLDSEITNPVGMKLKLIQPGSFWMGGSLRNEIPVHRVEITRPFYIGVYEVTQQEYIKVMGKKPSEYTGPNIPVGVTWNEANEFCRRLSELTGDKYRLPTEAEWEYAARGGMEKKEYVWGDNPVPEVNGIKYANVPDKTFKKKYSGSRIVDGYDGGFAELSPVGSFAPNGYGLYDMAGNAWERCMDWYDESYYSQSPVKDPQGPAKGERRVLRGGGHAFGHSERLRVAYRCGSPLDRAGSNDGFRVVMEVKYADASE
jgi:formylglycine-generating enzyme required for sulfatase activity